MVYRVSRRGYKARSHRHQRRHATVALQSDSQLRACSPARPRPFASGNPRRTRSRILRRKLAPQRHDTLRHVRERIRIPQTQQSGRTLRQDMPHPARPRRHPQGEHQLGTESRIQQLIILLNSLSSHLHSQSQCRWLFYYSSYGSSIRNGCFISFIQLIQ